MVKFHKHQYQYRYKKGPKGKTLYSAEKTNVSKKEERDAYKRLGLVFVVILVSSLVVYLWGIQAVNTISSFWLRFNPQQNTQDGTSSDTLVFPPRLDSLPNAINDLSNFKVAGWAPAGADVSIFVNQEEAKTVLADATGRFETSDISLKEGENKVYALAVVGNKARSHPSETQQVVFDKTKPELTVSEPEQNTTITENNRWLIVVGSTEPNTQIFINESQVIVDLDSNFKYQYPLTEGENKLEIIARDEAGNETVVERTVTFEPSGSEED